MTVPEPAPSLEDVPDDGGHAPPVVVTMVAHEPGPWFDDALRALADQDYPNLSVLVIDAGGDDVISRVADILPSAFVRRIEGNPGFGAAANEVLEVVEGAAFYLFCHDDVAVEPDAVRHLVDEALRSNAGVVGPKLVDWDDPTRLLEVGLTADKTGVVASVVDPGELDQEQHDAIRDVFLVSTACMLVRADLFRALGGFDAVMELHGEDLDLCWRAQVAGARVVVVPDARVRHRGRVEERREPGEGAERAAGERVRFRTRHRLRTVLTCYGRFHLLRVLPQAFLYLLAEVSVAVAGGRFQHARDLLGAWTWNLGRLGEIRERRRVLRALRRLPDREVRQLQARGSTRLNRFVRGELGSAERVRDSLAGVGRGISETFTSRSRQLALAVWVLVILVIVLGSRDLIANRIPLVTGLAPITDSPADLLRTYIRGWHGAGVGGETPVPTAVALLGLGGIPVFGARGLLQLLLVVGMLPLGAAGAWRLTRPLGSIRARAAGLGLYVANPLPYDAMARGAWGGLLVYGAAPFLLARLVRAAGDGPEPRPAGRLRSVAGYGLVLALLAAFVPLATVLFLVVALAMVAGSLATGGSRATSAAVVVAGAGALTAAVLHLPWTLDFVLPGADWWTFGGVSALSSERVAMTDLLRFQLGTVGVPVLGWAIPLAATMPLFIAQDWRFRWAVRCWAIALSCWSLAWVGSNGMLPIDVPPPHVVLVPAAIALALAAAIGVLAFEVDLRGFRFGLRQIASILAASFAVAAVVPVVVAAADGQWSSPRLDLGRTLVALAEGQDDGGLRTLWIGDPDVLPLAGYRLDDDLAYALADGGLPDVVDRFATSPAPSTELVADALHLVADGRSDRLGRLLAPFGIRYVVLLGSSAPSRAGALVEPLPAGLLATMGRQLDLHRVEVDPEVHLFENTAWMPVRALVQGPAAVEKSRSLASASAAATDFSEAAAAVDQIDAGQVHLAVPASSRWQLEVDGEAVPRSKSLGWANRYEVTVPGTAHLAYRPPLARYLAVLAQVALWVVVVLVARGRRPGVPS